jgi:hypothetical protein
MSGYPCDDLGGETIYRIYTFGELEYSRLEDKKAEAESCDCGYPSVDYTKEASKVNLRFQTESSLRQHQGNVLHEFFSL